jgi:hypothetical protein
MLIFYFKPNSGDTLILNNTAHSAFDGEFSEKIESGNLICTVFKNQPNQGNSYYPPLNAVIAIKEQKVKLFGDLLLLKNKDGYEVKYSLNSIPLYQPPSVVLTKAVTSKNLNHHFTLIVDSKFRLICECETASLTKDIDYIICDPNIAVQQTNYGLLIALAAKCEDKEYLQICLFNGKYETLFECTADEIDYTSSTIAIKNKLQDMLGRVKSNIYTFSGGFKLISSTLEYTHDIPYPDTLIPCLFLEALIAGDKTRANSYLGEDINNSDTVKEYLGPFDSFFAEDSSALPDTFVLLDSKITSGIVEPKRIRFQVENKKIVNLAET